MCVSEERGLGRGGEGEGEGGREESSLFSNSSVRHQSQYLVQKCPPQTHVGEAVMGERWEVERGGGGEGEREGRKRNILGQLHNGTM